MSDENKPVQIHDEAVEGADPEAIQLEETGGDDNKVEEVNTEAGDKEVKTEKGKVGEQAGDDAQKEEKEEDEDRVVVKKKGPSRDLEAARKAYRDGDVDAMIQAHKTKKAEKKGGDEDDDEDGVEMHGGAGSEFIKSIVFGGIDGIITTFSVISASVGAGLKMEVLLLMGFANLISDGISMGFGDFLSEKAELEFVASERAREELELETYPKGERTEMIELYTERRGLTEEEAATIIDIMMKYKDFFVDVMMVEELGLMPSDPDDNPAVNGLITFLAFLLFGSIPMWFYLISWAADWEDDAEMFVVACFITALTMFLLGVVKAKITRLERDGQIKSGLWMVLNGSLAAIAAYLIGWGLEEAMDVDL